MLTITDIPVRRATAAPGGAGSRDRVVAAGVTVIEIQDRAPWATLMEPVYAKYASDPRLAALVQQIRALP